MPEQQFSIEAKQITFLTTNKCTAECGHCSVSSSPRRKGTLTAKQMIKTIDDFIALSNIQLVIFAGGEPTLLGNELLEVIAYADSRRLLTRLMTNGHWATSPKAAKAKLVELREVGLQEINISCDDYHLPYIPSKRLRYAWDATRGLKFSSVVIASASNENSIMTPEKIMEILGEKVPLIYDDDGSATVDFNNETGEVRVISNANLARLGRGVQFVPESELRIPVRQQSLDQRCRWISSSPAISPSNHLLSCCGMEASGRAHLDYGSLEQTPLASLIDKAQKSPVVRAIGVLGPYRVMSILRTLEPGAMFWDQYSGVCELCAHMFDRPAIADLLTKHADTFELLAQAAI